MSDDNRVQQLERLVALRYAKEIDRIVGEIAEEQQAKGRELAASGMRSGANVAAYIKLGLKRLDASDRASYGVYKEVYGTAELLSPDRLRKRGQKEVARFDVQTIVEHVKSNPMTKDIIPVGDLEKIVTRDVEKARTLFLHDVEIDAMTLSVEPSTVQNKTPVNDPFPYTYDVFISFATPDRDAAKTVARLLGEHGLKVFFSPKELQGGDDWEEVIRAALVASRELCLIVSQSSLTREWVLTEWGAAWATEKRIIPVLIDCTVDELPARLRSKQSVPLSDLQAYAADAAKRILRQAASGA